MNANRNPTLILAGVGSLAASILHLACIAGGPDWYRFFGAGERMARMAARGHWYPTVVTLGTAFVARRIILSPTTRPRLNLI
jgi:hypothetical protein